MPEAMFIMSSAQDYGLRELAATLQHELELQAVPSALHFGGLPSTRPAPVFIVLDPRSYAAAEGGDWLANDTILRRTIFICNEPALSPCDTEHVALLRRAGAVFALDQRSVAALHRVGVRARLLRPGYSRALDRFDPEAERPIDVLFLGVESPRRTRYLTRVAELLSGRECRLVTAPRLPTAEDVDSPLAAARWPLLRQSKVLITLHHDGEAGFAWREALDAIHAGAVVITEHSDGLGPLVAGEHLFVTSADALPYVVEAVLRDEPRLAEVRAGAYERLSGWLPYALWVAVLRAAIVELVGEPVPDTDLAVTRSAAS